ncbi:MAG: hypothetical protein VKL97_00105 [Cyanobacteriota bacterium]|nr:hypothetical protein [Cyanobacteriota bacterium]
MLPALPSPPHRATDGINRQCRWITRGLLAAALLLSLGLSACSRLPTPPQATVLSALTLQIELTQQAIAQALALPPAAAPSVRHVRIDNQRNLRIGEGRGLQISGHFDWRLGDDTTSTESPFELYLQQGERGQSWRLARPIGSSDDASSQQWLIDPLPIPS